LVYFLSQFYQKGGVFSLKNPLKSRFFSIYFGAKVELLTKKREWTKNMRSHGKKHIIYLLVLSVLFGLLLSQSISYAKKITIAYLLPNVGPWYTDKWYGVEDEAKKLGVEAILYTAGGYENISKQVAQVEDLIEKGVDGIIIHPCSASALIPPIKKALEAGIKASSEHAPLAEPLIPHIWEDPSRLGWQMAEYLAAALKGKGVIIAHAGPPGQYEAKAMWEGFTAYMKYFPGIELYPEWSTVNVGNAMKVTEDLLTAHPDTKGIYCWFEPMAQGAASALKTMGYQPGQVELVTGWANGETLRLLKEGWVTYLWPGTAVEVGRTSVRNMVKMINGEEVPLINNVPMIGINAGMLDLWDRSGWAAPAQQ